MEIATRDPGRKHFYLSLVKSAMRIVGCVVAAGTSSVVLLAFFFAVA